MAMLCPLLTSFHEVLLVCIETDENIKYNKASCN